MSREAVDEVEQLRHELDEERDRRLRLLAEFDNFRRRAARERETAGAEGRRAALRPLLAVLDTLERALAAGSSDRDFYDGVAATHRLFVDAPFVAYAPGQDPGDPRARLPFPAARSSSAPDPAGSSARTSSRSTATARCCSNAARG